MVSAATGDSSSDRLGSATNSTIRLARIAWKVVRLVRGSSVALVELVSIVLASGNSDVAVNYYFELNLTTLLQ